MNSFHFDCLHPKDTPTNSERPKKYTAYRTGVLYNEPGYNFGKQFLDTTGYESENFPSVLYEYESGHISKIDRCESEPLPERYVPKTNKKYTFDSQQINQAILSESQTQNKLIVSKLESQNNATADGFNAIVSELQSQINATTAGFKTILSEFLSQNKVIVAELQSENNATVNSFKEILLELQSQNKAIVSELQSQNNATVIAFQAIVSELQRIKASSVDVHDVHSAKNTEILSEMRSQNATQ